MSIVAQDGSRVLLESLKPGPLGFDFDEHIRRGQSPLERLTRRREALACVAREWGWTYREIGDAMFADKGTACKMVDRGNRGIADLRRRGPQAIRDFELEMEASDAEAA